MATNKFLPLEQFTFIATPPELRTQIMCVNVYADGRLSLSGKLAEKLSGKTFQIRFTGDAKHLCFIEAHDENSIRFPKNGSKRLPSVSEHLKAQRLPLPARYKIFYDETENFWQGDYFENPPRLQAQTRSSSRRK